ncbi:hypothetical protein COCOBI_18-1640 [Coccomyxa sp. Obi]|nr:hypothetical protein COCOBI_18-1640 [Coccomyxa sp. Obi]
MFGLSALRPSSAQGKGLDGLSNPTQTKQGSQYGRSVSTKPNLQPEISWCNGTTWCSGNIPGRLDDLDLQQWQPPEDLVAQGALSPSAERPDDLLPTMRSLMEVSDVSGSTAFPGAGAVEGTEIPHISFPGATTAPFHQAQSHIQLDSFSLDPLYPYSVTVAAASHKDCAVDWCDLLDDIRMPLISVAEQAPLQGWEMPLTATGNTGDPVHGQPEKAPRFSCTLSPSSPCSVNTSSQTGACLAATWARSSDVHYSPVELPQTPSFPLAPERTGSTGSNDSSNFTYCTAPATAAPAVPFLRGTPRPCTDAVTPAPAASRGGCALSVPANRRPPVRTRAGRSSLYPVTAAVRADTAAGPSGARATFGPQAISAAASAGPGGARAPAGPRAIPAAASAGRSGVHALAGPPAVPAAAAAGRSGARAPAGPTAPTAASRMAPRIVTRGTVIMPRVTAPSAPARSRPVMAPAPPASRQVTGAPAVRLAAAERNRKVQRKYLQRKQAKEQATHASVGHLEERLAELQAQMEPLLAQHEQLTRSLPWHQQQEEVDFMASIASSSSCRSEANPDMQSPPSPSRFIENMMLEPVATVDQILESVGLHDFTQDDNTNHNASAAPFSACTAPRNAARCSSDPAPLQSLVARLRLTNSQKKAIGEGYARHVQAEAFLLEDCLALATKLQKLPTPVAVLECSSQPILARHLISSQLGGIVKRDRELTQRLTHTCLQVLNRHQVDLLRQLAPSEPLDWPTLCREITCRRLKRSRPQPTTDSTPTAQPKKRVASRATAVRQKGA